VNYEISDEEYLENLIIYYEQILSDYLVELYYGGLNYCDKWKLLENVLTIHRFNEKYMSAELQELEDRLTNILDNLKSINVGLSLTQFIQMESSLVHLFFTNNECEQIFMHGHDNFKFLCPFHDEKKPSLTVSNKRGLYYCYGCGARAHAVDYIMEYENFTYEEAIGLLARIYLIDIDFNVIAEDDERIKKYRDCLFSENFMKLLVRGHNRSRNQNISDVFIDKYYETIKLIERVKNNKHIKYTRMGDSPKKLEYILPEYNYNAK